MQESARRALFGITTQGQVDTWRAELAQQQAIVDTTRRTRYSRISTRWRCVSAK